MFRVKKEDYNSVQFIPDYNSSSTHKSKARRSARKRHSKAIFIAVIAVIIIAVAAAAVGVYLYFTYFNPTSKYARALSEGDFDTCQQISSENAFDSGFVSAIEAPVTDAAQKVLDSYKDGSLAGAEAISQLNNFNTISDNCFKDKINSMINEINTIESLHSNVTAVQDTFAAGKYLEGVDQLMTAAATAAEHKVDVENDISSVVEGSTVNIKETLFSEFSTLIRNENYDKINSYIDFITKYDTDSDYADFKTTVSEVQDGTTKIKAASRDAKNIASAAKREARQQARDAEDQTAAQE